MKSAHPIMVVAALSCIPDHYTPEPTMNEPITIQANTKARLGDCQVGVQNIWERTYQLPDGSARTALSAQLVHEGKVEVVGVGSHVRVGETTWDVLSVKKPLFSSGNITLQALETGG